MNFRPFSRHEDSDLVEIKETLSELLDVLRLRDGGPKVPKAPPPTEATPADALDYAKRLLTIRTGRRRFLPAGYFDGPALTILLDLYVSNREGRQVAVSDAVAVSGVPTSTALRWIATMEADGYVSKRPDPGDKRRTLLNPTPRAMTDIERLTALWRNTF
ncbi:MarR family transcriptional regulator [Sphingomonas gilva]|nr:MarR family transcriptional regulator [Sphingomonas gilva]